MAETKIEWAHYTFNPWRGCVKVSEACRHCYAEGWAKRTGKDIWGPDKAREMAAPAYWTLPEKWNREAWASKERRRVFCSSLADVFEDRLELVPHRARLFNLIEKTPNLDWLLLTKRPENMLRLSSYWIETAGWWPSNAWAGTTAEDQENADRRIAALVKVPARIRFLSMEPLLGYVDLQNAIKRANVKWRKVWPIQWVIVGGESGGKARPLNPEWVKVIRDDCRTFGAAFHFKQWGEYEYLPVMAEDIQQRLVHTGEWRSKRVGKKLAGRLFEGRTWDEVPV